MNNTEELDMNENHDYNLRSKICHIMTKVYYLWIEMHQEEHKTLQTKNKKVLEVLGPSTQVLCYQVQVLPSTFTWSRSQVQVLHQVLIFCTWYQVLKYKYCTWYNPALQMFLFQCLSCKRPIVATSPCSGSIRWYA